MGVQVQLPPRQGPRDLVVRRTGVVSACFGEYVPRIWDAATGRPVTSLRRHPTGVQSAALSPDGRTLATADLHGDLRLWETATGRQLATLAGNDASVVTIVFSPDGRTLAAGGVGSTIWTWDVVQSTASPSRGSTVSEGRRPMALHIRDAARCQHIPRASREDADQFTFVFALVERRRLAPDVGRRLRDPS